MPKRKGKKITAKVVQSTQDQPTPVSVPIVPIKPEPDDEGWGDDNLTTRQRLFVDALLGPAGGNATKAAEIAGYRSDNREALRVTACENLTKPNVQRAVARAYARKMKDPEWVKDSLTDIANSSMANFLKLDGDKCLLDMSKAAEAGALGQIKEYREEVLKVGEGAAEVIKRTVKIHDRVPALQTLLKLEGKLGERLILEGQVNHKHSIDYDAIERELRGIGNHNGNGNGRVAGGTPSNGH